MTENKEKNVDVASEEKESDPSIKFGDLVSFLSTETEYYFFGDGVRGRCVGKEKKLMVENFSDAVFKIQPKFEYKNAKEYKAFTKFQKGKKLTVDDEKQLKKIEGTTRT